MNKCSLYICKNAGQTFLKNLISNRDTRRMEFMKAFFRESSLIGSNAVDNWRDG